MFSRALKKAGKVLLSEAVKAIEASLLATLKDIIFGKIIIGDKELAQLVHKIDSMSGEEFEEFLSICFKRLGYQVRATPKSNDFGADLILTKDSRKTVVQAKRYRGKVGSAAVQEVVGAIKYYGAQEAIVITNSQFTASARELARPNGVILWGREQLIDLINRAAKPPQISDRLI